MKMDAQDRKWQRESDARTLAEAEQIKTTPSRLKGAVKEAGVMAKHSEKQTKAMKKVAKRAPRIQRKTSTRSISTGKRTGGAIVRSNTNTPLSRSKRK